MDRKQWLRMYDRRERRKNIVLLVLCILAVFVCALSLYIPAKMYGIPPCELKHPGKKPASCSGGSESINTQSSIGGE